jgi:hypothetical protein
VPQNEHPPINLIRKLVVRIAAHMQIELYHARLICCFFVLLLLVLYAFCDASYDGDGDYRAAEEKT